MNFLNSFSNRNRNFNRQPVSQKQSLNFKPKENLQSLEFTHGKNVILKRGPNKGCKAYVSEYYPARYLVEFAEQHYVFVYQYGLHHIGSVIQTEFGMSKIEQVIPPLLEFSVSNEQISEDNVRKIVKESLRLPETAVMRVIAYKDNNDMYHLGKLEMGTSEDNVVYCRVHPISLNSKFNTVSSLLEKLSVIIKTKESINYEMNDNISCTNIEPPEYVFVTAKPISDQDINYLGEYGQLVRFIAQQYLISTPKRVLITKRNLSTKDSVRTGTMYNIKNGEFKGKLAMVIEKREPELVLYVDATGVKMTTHRVFQNEQYIEKPITPSDVFYMDLTLKNGNLFQVNKIKSDGTIIGIEKDDNKLIPSEITKDDIWHKEPGFSFEETEEEQNEYSSDEITYEAEPYNDTDLIQTNEDDSQFEWSYNDFERSAIMHTPLTSEQKSIKLMINKMFSIFAVDQNDVYIYDLVEKIGDLIKQLRNMLKNTQFANTWIQADVKYIVAFVVLGEIIKQGMHYIFIKQLDNIPGEFISKLFEHKILTRPQNSIFLQNGWTNTFTVKDDVIKSLKKNKQNIELGTLIFENCTAFLRSIVDMIPFEVNVNDQRLSYNMLIPLVPKKKIEKQFAFIDEYLATLANNTPLPEDTNKLLWGPDYTPLLEQAKKDIIQMGEQASPENKPIWKYVYDNFEQAPYVLQKLEKMNQTETSQYKQLQQAWNVFVPHLVSFRENLKQEKQNRIETIQEEQRQKNARREMAVMSSKFTNVSLDEEVNDNEM